MGAGEREGGALAGSIEPAPSGNRRVPLGVPPLAEQIEGEVDQVERLGILEADQRGVESFEQPDLAEYPWQVRPIGARDDALGVEFPEPLTERFVLGLDAQIAVPDLIPIGEAREGPPRFLLLHRNRLATPLGDCV